MAKSIKEVPCPILVDIFCKLPIKTLIQCKRVCKAWRDLLLDPIFVKLHLSRSATSIIGDIREVRELCLLEHQEKDRSSNDDDDVIVTKLKRTDWNFGLMASCDGLICYHEWQGREYLIHIINPIIGEHMYITLPKGEKVPWVFGIGFNPNTSLYMVLRIYFSKLFGFERYWEADICTLGVGAVTWRNIVNVPQNFDDLIGCDGTFINGAMHCLFEYFICSFNFDTEKFQSNLKLPEKNTEWFWMSLGVLKDCLSVSGREYVFGEYVFHFWVMKEYGVSESWTKEIVITNSKNNLYSPSFLKIIKYTEDGDIILFSDYLFSYNLKKESFRKLDKCGIGYLFNAIAYVPSFVSLKDVAVGETICCSN